MATNTISKIKLLDNVTYEIKDKVAREAIAKGFTYKLSTNAATTPQGVTWKSGGTTITGTLVASADTKGIFYLVPAEDGKTEASDYYREYITIDDGAETPTYSWEKMGNTKIDLDDLGDLAFKDNASAEYTPAGTIGTQTFTGNSATITVNGTATGNIVTGTGTANYTPAGTISGIAFTGSEATFAGKFTPAGTIGTQEFTGTEVTITTSGTATGTVAGATAATASEATYTPAGSVAAPTITITTSDATKYVADSATGGGSVTAGVAAECTLPTFTAAVGSSDDAETLIFTWTSGAFTANTPTAVTMPTFTSQAIVAGITSAESTAPAFTGTGAKLTFTGNNVSFNGTYKPSGTVAQATFTGTEGDVSVSGTTTGSISSQGTFSGTGVELKFSGTAFDSTGSYTPSGTVAQASFTGTAATITVS